MISLNYKQVLLQCLFVLLTTTLKAQINLVSDGSFEDTTNTVNGSGQTSLKQWRNLDSTKPFMIPFGYFCYFSQNPTYSLPDNQWCYQNPHSGGGVALFDFIWGSSASWKRSLSRIKLKNHLIAGKSYCAKMYVNPCEKYNGYFTDGIQLYFDNGQLDTIVSIDSSGVYSFVNPQVSNPLGNILNDTMNWTLVSGTFTAVGTEKFLTIGNFKADSNTQLLLINAPGTFYSASSLLIDDVSVIEVNTSNWLHDTSIVLGDSVYIGLPIYEVTDALWYDINMNYIGKGSGIKVKPTQWATQYIQAIDVCSSIRYDTMTVWAAPLAINQFGNEAIRQLEIYPNPSDGEFSILSNETLTNASIHVVNIIGETVFQSELLSGRSFSFDLHGEVNGVYFVEIKTDKGIKRMKVVKK